MTDLQRVGLVDCVENSYELRDDPEVGTYLQQLTRAFEDPLVRQEILQHLKYKASLVAPGGFDEG
jgi:hypothetical protein